MSMSSTPEVTAPPGDRRTRRRQETIEEILTIADDVMTEEGVNGLSLSEVARRLGVKPPSIYKYFDSLLAIYDALFERGQRTHLEIMRTAMAGAEPGLDALAAGLEASGRWALDHPATAQLLFWRPVPNFQPTPDAMAPSVEMVRSSTPSAHRRRRSRPTRRRCRLRRGALDHIGPRQRRHRSSHGQRTRPPLGRGPLQPAASQASRHTHPPLPPKAHPPPIVSGADPSGSKDCIGRHWT